MTPELIAQMRQIKDMYAENLLGKRNVVGVGLGYKVKQGVQTGELSLVVSVTCKEEPAALDARDLVPEMIEGVKTDVVATGVLRAFDLGPRDRWRPVVPPGASIGHYRSKATGTFGCLVRRGGETFILSNNHVLTDMNRGKTGDAILQPGPRDGGGAVDRIATLADFVPLDFGTTAPECPCLEVIAKLLNYVAAAFRSSHRLLPVKQTAGINRVDAALARPLSPALVKDEILCIGKPRGVGEATLGMAVQKTGRTTGHTQGTITQIDATVRVEYGDSSALFAGQLVADLVSRPGDSGSAVLDMNKNVVGLLFAGSEVVTIINPIEEVLARLNVELVVG